MESVTLTDPNDAFDSLIAVSPSFSSDSSSDLDTESTGSFFYDKSITLGNLIGIQTDLRVSTRVGDGQESGSSETPRRHKRNSRSKSWWGLCGSCLANAQERNNMPPSLGQFLEMERRAAATEAKTYLNMMFEEYCAAGHRISDTNTLFAADGRILPPYAADQSLSMNTNEAAADDDSDPSWVPPEWFSADVNSGRSSQKTHNRHHRSLSLKSRVPTFFSGICGRT